MLDALRIALSGAAAPPFRQTAATLAALPLDPPAAATAAGPTRAPLLAAGKQVAYAGHGAGAGRASTWHAIWVCRGRGRSGRTRTLCSARAPLTVRSPAAPRAPWPWPPAAAAAAPVCRGWRRAGARRRAGRRTKLQQHNVIMLRSQHARAASATHLHGRSLPLQRRGYHVGVCATGRRAPVPGVRSGRGTGAGVAQAAQQSAGRRAGADGIPPLGVIEYPHLDLLTSISKTPGARLLRGDKQREAAPSGNSCKRSGIISTLERPGQVRPARVLISARGAASSAPPARLRPLPATPQLAQRSVRAAARCGLTVTGRRGQGSPRHTAARALPPPLPRGRRSRSKSAASPSCP